MEDKTKIVIADDHPMFREGLARTVEHVDGFVIVGKAGDGAEALGMIREYNPDIAVLDVSMPELDGLEVARRVHEEALATEIIILTMYKDLNYFNAALDLGVRGYVLKDSATNEFLSCLKAIKEGQYYISPAISHLLVERDKTARSLAESVPALQNLTPAERSILKLVAQNLTSRQISEKIFVSVRTVENHRLHICQKLGIKGHNKLLEFALRNKGAL